MLFARIFGLNMINFVLVQSNMEFWDFSDPFGGLEPEARACQVSSRSVVGLGLHVGLFEHTENVTTLLCLPISTCLLYDHYSSSLVKLCLNLMNNPLN